MDLSYTEYSKYVRSLLEPDAIREQVRNTVPSPKFEESNDGSWQVVRFAGYTVVTPPFVEDNYNSWLYLRLAEMAERINRRIGTYNVGTLPLSSFHLTVSDLLFNGSLSEYVKQGGSEADLLRRVGSVFEESFEGSTPQLRPVGVCSPGNAVILVLDFATQEGYEQVVHFRSLLHQEFGLEMREYLAHISLAYKQFDGKIFSDAADALLDVNRETDWDSLPNFQLYRADLRFFPDMHNFIRDLGWPQYCFDNPTEGTE